MIRRERARRSRNDAQHPETLADGTAVSGIFARHVRNLRDDDFRAPALVEGWARAEVVAFVGLSARAL
jgi:hypothetical protein